MGRHINALGLQKLKQWEGLRLESYQDEEGNWTIGYGHTAAAGEPYVFPGMTITEQKAEEILRSDLAKFEGSVERMVKVPLTDGQFAALVSFHFNTGALATSTLLKKLNTGNYNAVPIELMKWVKTTDPKTKKKITSPGLVNRRAAEAGLWATGEPVATNTVAVAPAAPPALTKENIAFGATTLAGMGSLFDGSGPMQWVLAGVLGVSFASLAFLVIKRHWKPS